MAMWPEPVNRQLRFSAAERWLVGVPVVICVLLCARGAEADDERDRYIAASIAIQCGAMQPKLWTDATKRERAVDALLVTHGFRRASYAQAGFLYAADRKVTSAVQAGVGRCTPETLTGRFVGAFKNEDTSGSLDVRYRRRSVRGGVRIQIRGRNIRIPIRSQSLRGNRIVTAGKNGGTRYSMVLTHMGNHVEGELVVEDGTATLTVPLRAELK